MPTSPTKRLALPTILNLTVLCGTFANFRILVLTHLTALLEHQGAVGEICLAQLRDPPAIEWSGLHPQATRDQLSHIHIYGIPSHVVP